MAVEPLVVEVVVVDLPEKVTYKVITPQLVVAEEVVEVVAVPVVQHQEEMEIQGLLVQQIVVE